MEHPHIPHQSRGLWRLVRRQKASWVVCDKTWALTWSLEGRKDSRSSWKENRWLQYGTHREKQLLMRSRPQRSIFKILTMEQQGKKYRQYFVNGLTKMASQSQLPHFQSPGPNENVGSLVHKLLRISKQWQQRIKPSMQSPV